MGRGATDCSGPRNAEFPSRAHTRGSVPGRGCGGWRWVLVALVCHACMWERLTDWPLGPIFGNAEDGYRSYCGPCGIEFTLKRLCWPSWERVCAELAAETFVSAGMVKWPSGEWRLQFTMASGSYGSMALDHFRALMGEARP